MSTISGLIDVCARVVIAGFAAKAVDVGAYGTATFLTLMFAALIGNDIERAIRGRP